ncbi:MAG: glutamate racemase [Firmicutes bacterium]|nr:glutamate racemase [Bacillota bacterium]
MKIGVFDSGSGGLTVLRELENRLPGNEYVYFGDYARAPYGDQPRETIVQYSKEITDFMLSQNVDMMVVACNTIVAAAMDEIKAMSSVPVVGVVEPAIEYLSTCGYKNVGVAATTATITSGIYTDSLAAHGISATAVACPDFVPLIETNNFGPDLDTAVEKYMGDFVGKGIEAVVLGCTHYPIIRGQLQDFFNKSGESIELVDPAMYTANHIDRHREGSATDNGQRKTTLWFGKVDVSLRKRAGDVLGRDVEPMMHSL